MQILKKKKGFTLIELLVVIAIIGILAAIVLVALQGARAKAKDARIISDMNQYRDRAEIIASDANGVYGGVNCAADTDLNKLCQDVITQTTSTANPGGIPVNETFNAGGYCAYATLNTTPGTQYFCVDSALNAAQMTTVPTCAGAGVCK